MILSKCLEIIFQIYIHATECCDYLFTSQYFQHLGVTDCTGWVISDSVYTACKIMDVI